MATMKAVQIHAYGTPDVLVYEDAPVPTIGKGEVLVEVHAASVNPVDTKTRHGSGVAGNLGASPFPIIVGWDISGVVVGVAEDVTDLVVGDEVYGMVNFPRRGNAYAEYVAAPAIELAKKPATLSHAEAAALPLAILTAWQGLFEDGHLEAGQRVLIHAGAGGVGHLAVQLARWKGAYVIATASARNSEFVKALGADEVIDYTTTAFESAVAPVDLVLDCVGDAVLAKSLVVVKRGGAVISIVTFATDAQKAEAEAGGFRLLRPLVRPNASQLQEITELVAAGTIRPEIAATFPLAEAHRAHVLSETGRTRGKIILTVK